MKTMMLELRLSDGKVLARRRDGKPLSERDRLAAKTIAHAKKHPLHASVRGEVQDENSSPMAIRMSSKILGDDFWLILDERFIARDDRACFYPDELFFIKQETLKHLAVILDAKLKYPRCRIVQDVCCNVLARTESSTIYRT
jgi:hypothetical protein